MLIIIHNPELLLLYNKYIHFTHLMKLFTDLFSEILVKDELKQDRLPNMFMAKYQITQLSLNLQ